MHNSLWLLILVLILGISCDQKDTDVMVIGAGTGAVSAAIASSRHGSRTVLLNPIPWLGGMLSSAGVSSIDGNHEMRAGLYGEFRSALIENYGGEKELATGWISHTLFEPHVADSILKYMAGKEPLLQVEYNTQWKSISYVDNVWQVMYIDATGEERAVNSKILIDGTDLGDVAAHVGASYRLGMDSRLDTNEDIAPLEANDIIQDLTYTAILKDYGKEADRTIIRPFGYNADEFDCACREFCAEIIGEVHPCSTMMSYAKLPNNKYLVNWPRKGNDYYVNDVELSQDERKSIYEKARAKTLRFIYFIQDELGFRNLGIADDEFPTTDGLPFMPYHREGRRIKGKALMTLHHITDPFATDLYRTGIAVGDYPIDHHHLELHDAPDIAFPLVPSFNIPIGALIPNDVTNLLIADKAISVSNIVNGSSRLQPVVLQIGQAAGIIASVAIQEKVIVGEVDIRKVQLAVLDKGGYIMPYWDVKVDHLYFTAIQKIGACGILKGVGEPYKWANRTWFHPNRPLDREALVTGLEPYFKRGFVFPKGEITKNWINELFSIDDNHAVWGIETLNGERTKVLTRASVAYLIDSLLDPFQRSIEFDGSLKVE